MLLVFNKFEDLNLSSDFWVLLRDYQSLYLKIVTVMWKKKKFVFKIISKWLYLKNVQANRVELKELLKTIYLNEYTQITAEKA